MQPIIFNDDIICYKTKYNSIYDKSILIDIIQNNISLEAPDFEKKKDAYNISDSYIKYFEDIIKFSADKCMELFYKKNKKYTHIHNNIWINIIKAQNPIQINSIDKPVYHIHTELRKPIGDFVPEYTFVYYIQIPNNLSGSDGMLLMKNKKDEVFNFLPEENDLIIMDGDLPHAPMNSPNSTVDRLVVAGNIGFTFIKDTKTLF